jgi:hypothetical protein
MMSAFFYYLPTRPPARCCASGTPSGQGPIQNDMWSVCTTTKKPVLAHLFLNFMLDNGVAPTPTSSTSTATSRR